MAKPEKAGELLEEMTVTVMDRDDLDYSLLERLEGNIPHGENVVVDVDIYDYEGIEQGDPVEIPGGQHGEVDYIEGDEVEVGFDEQVPEELQTSECEWIQEGHVALCPEDVVEEV